MTGTATHLCVLRRLQVKFHSDCWYVRKPLCIDSVLSERHVSSGLKYLKETGVFLSLLTQRIKDNGKMMQSGGIIADREGAYRED
jgi:hypothetical protein